MGCNSEAIFPQSPSRRSSLKLGQRFLILVPGCSKHRSTDNIGLQGFRSSGEEIAPVFCAWHKDQIAMLRWCSKPIILSLMLLSASMILLQQRCFDMDHSSAPPNFLPRHGFAAGLRHSEWDSKHTSQEAHSQKKDFSSEKICVFTISAFNNYGFVKSFLSRAEALHPDINCFIWIVADNRHTWVDAEENLPAKILEDFPKKWHAVVVDQLQPYMNYSFMELAFRYDMTCFNTAIKPIGFKYIFDKHGASKVLYLDNDIWLMEPLTEVISALDKYSLVVTPHITQEIPLDGYRQDERQIMLAGQFNFGFVASSRSKTTARWLDWWAHRLHFYGYAKPNEGMHFDQNWADMIVSYYPQEEYFILRDPRYNIAYWNLHYRGAHLHMVDGRVMYDSEPAVFMHFSGMSSLLDYDIETISRHQNRYKMSQFPNLRPIFEKYLAMLQAENTMRWRHVPYGFCCFKDGTAIPDAVRMYFAQMLDPTSSFQEDARSFQEVVAYEEPFNVDSKGSKISVISWMLQGAHHLIVESQGVDWLPEIAWQLYESRPDLRKVFPDILDQNLEAYQGWFRNSGFLKAYFLEAEKERKSKKKDKSKRFLVARPLKLFDFQQNFNG